jgi:hypothetical protein
LSVTCQRLASSAIVDSIDGVPNPKLLNRFNVNALSSFHGCAAANPVPRMKIYIWYIEWVIFVFSCYVQNKENIKYLPMVAIFKLFVLRVKTKYEYNCVNAIKRKTTLIHKWSSLPVTCPCSVVLSMYSGFFHH